MLIFGDDDPFAPIKPGTTQIMTGDCRYILEMLPTGSVDCCITSPPYFSLRDYGNPDQIGLESTPDTYIDQLLNVFREVYRVLKNDGTLWLNLGDSYARNGGSDQNVSATAKVGSTRNAIIQRGDRTQKIPNGFKSKDLLMIPARVAIALCNDGWYLRSDIIWEKPNCMPESVQDRPTSAHEHVFLLTKQQKYYYDAQAIREAVSASPVTVGRNQRSDKGLVGAAALYGNGFGQSGNGGFARGKSDTRNARNVWSINTVAYQGAHFATMPPELVRRCVLAGTKPKEVVLDPFGGAGTTGLVAQQLGRDAILIELNEDYANLAQERLQQKSP